MKNPGSSPEPMANIIERFYVQHFKFVLFYFQQRTATDAAN